jgi:hypothetical protein
MKLCIPTLGQNLKLLADWRIQAHEGKNSDLIRYFHTHGGATFHPIYTETVKAFQKKNPTYPFLPSYMDEDLVVSFYKLNPNDREAIWKARAETVICEFTIPAGTILRVIKVNIKRGYKGSEYIEFSLGLPHHKGKLRLHAPLKGIADADVEFLNELS